MSANRNNVQSRGGARDSKNGVAAPKSVDPKARPSNQNQANNQRNQQPAKTLSPEEQERLNAEAAKVAADKAAADKAAAEIEAEKQRVQNEIALEYQQRVGPVDEVIKRICIPDNKVSQDVRRAAAKELANRVVSEWGGVQSLYTRELLSLLAANINDKKNDNARVGALFAYSALIEVIGLPVAPALIPSVLNVVFDMHGDRARPVHFAAVEALTAFARLPLGNVSLENIWLPALFVALDVEAKWQAKMAALAHLTNLANSEATKNDIANLLHLILPRVIGLIGDIKINVADAARDALLVLCHTAPNPDLKPFIPALVNCMCNPKEVTECVFKLGATTFVTAVTSSTLAVLLPVLLRALRENSVNTATKRMTAVIADSMARLIEKEIDVIVFMPTLLPALARIAIETPDPECREIGNKAVNTLKMVAKNGNVSDVYIAAAARAIDLTIPVSLVPTCPEFNLVLTELRAVFAQGGDEVSALVDSPFAVAVINHVAAITASLIVRNDYDEETWRANSVPYLSALTKEAVALASALLTRCQGLAKAAADAAKAEYIDEDEGEDLCNCELSLAYGSKVLLNNTRLHLKRGHRYGLVGPNGSGKSTLMNAITNDQLDGFPSKDVLRTVYVMADIAAEFAEMTVMGFVLIDPLLSGVPESEISETLSSVNFTHAMQYGPVLALSGGWRMKLALARAMLKKPDILLLDEPTNHLDVTNIAWLEGYLNSLVNVTCVMVSHDSGFLDHVCTDIIHCNFMKLTNYRGNLSEFVKKVPEAKAYYELKAVRMVMKFPEPGYLEGVRDKNHTILRMDNCGFTYPGTTKEVLKDISIAVSMASRCAVVGPNGAGKSTMIKLLIGELEPDRGTMWAHSNMRVGYIAQHAFFHIESHLTKTPNEYIRWRYDGGEDKEAIAKAVNQVTPEELVLQKQPVLVGEERKKMVVEKVIARRQRQRTYEYECQFVGKSAEDNAWISRSQLEKGGWLKSMQRIDEREAAAKHAWQKTLSSIEVEKHLGLVGLEPEFATHYRMDALSTSQKVKVVLAAACWNNPHIIVLDEPTNYLDRESLGALAQAIRDFNGGVIMISHHTEFTEALCPETWFMAGGLLHVEGAVAQAINNQLAAQAQETTRVDALGNESEIKGAVPTGLSRKDRRHYLKEKAARKAAGIDSDDEDDY